VAAVNSVTVNNLPYNILFNDAPGLPVRIVPAGPGPMQTTIVETLVTGLMVACVWRPAAQPGMPPVWVN
jgi:hypothetical protein